MTSAGLATASCEEETGFEDEEEELDRAEAAVHNGGASSFDSEFSAKYPASVRLRVNKGTEANPVYGYCSGTLVTPKWVLTAAHCIDEDDGGLHRSAKTWTVYVSHLGTNDDPDLTFSRDDRTFTHTLATSGLVWYLDAPSPPAQRRDTDIALVELDKRVPHPIGIHAKLPVANGCGNFGGRIVGFSNEGFDEGGFHNGVPITDENACPSNQGGRRQSGPADIWWVNQPLADAAVMAHLFSTPLHQVCDGMAGIGTDGDSGGSLYRTDSIEFPNLLCGVVSGDGPLQVWEENGYIFSDYHASSLDHPTNRDWINARIREGGTSNGFLEGSYESRNNGFDDNDDDGIANNYDNCPEVANLEQLTTFDDPDGDGAGAACDRCEGVPDGQSPLLDNLNYEIEFALSNGLQAPTDPDAPGYQDALDDYLDAYTPDACDPTPVPLSSLHDGSIEDPMPVPAGCAGLGGPCELHVRNEIRVDGRTTSDYPTGTNAMATVGFRFCDCKDAPAGTSTETLQGRRTCQTHPNSLCTYSASAFSSNPRWLAIRTPPQGAQNWSQAGNDKLWSVTPNEDFATFWDFRTLGPAVTTSSGSQSVKGLLWTSVRALSPPVAELPDAHLQAAAASLGTGDAYIKWKQPTPRNYKYLPDEAFCRECPMKLQHPYHEVGYPHDWRVTVEGTSRPFPAPDASTVQHYEQVAQGTVRHVPASEPLRVLSRFFPADSSFVRALGIEGQAVTRLLKNEGLDSVPRRSNWTATGSSPGAASGRGYAFSATRQRLYAIGGVPFTGGPPLNLGWVLDLADETWSSVPIPSAEGVGTVLAAKYRWQDGSIYFLDRVSNVLRLRRWNADRNRTSRVVQTLATFNTSWNTYNKLDLVNTPSGDLLLVAWAGTGSTKTMVAQVTIDKSNRITVPRIKTSTTHIHTAPAADLEGYTSVVPGPIGPTAVAPRAASTTFASMPTASIFLRPTILAH